MKKIMVIGSLNMDCVSRVSHIPKVGETISGTKPKYFPGGKGANQAVAMGKLGADITILGAVGDDNYGRTLINGLKKHHVKCNVKKVIDTETGMALIFVEDSGDNTIIVIDGANGHVSTSDITEDLIKPYDILVLQLEIPIETVKYAIELAYQQDKYIVLNPAPAQFLDDNLLSKISLLIVNETEFELLFNSTDFSNQNIKKIIEEKHIQSILLTMGSRGSKYISSSELYLVKAKKVNAVDTTAAGDGYIGGLVTCISQNKPIEDAMKFATDVAAITVTRQGAQHSLPTLEEVYK